MCEFILESGDLFMRLITQSVFRLCSGNLAESRSDVDVSQCVEDTLSVLVSAAEAHLLPWMVVSHRVSGVCALLYMS